MIFITVGTQLPFDRLLENFAEWHDTRSYTGATIAQVGEGSQFTHPDITIFNTLPMDQYYHWFCQAQGVVAHAGMGSILSCLEQEKRGVFLPRQYALGEHRNDHQFDTVKAFTSRYPTLALCSDKQAFFSALDELVTSDVDHQIPSQRIKNNELGRHIAEHLGLQIRKP